MTLLTRIHSKNIMPDLNEFMTTQETAEKLGFTIASVRQMVFKKKLESTRFGRSILIPKKAVLEYLEKTKGMSKNQNFKQSMRDKKIWR